MARRAVYTSCRSCPRVNTGATARYPASHASVRLLMIRHGGATDAIPAPVRPHRHPALNSSRAHFDLPRPVVRITVVQSISGCGRPYAWRDGIVQNGRGAELLMPLTALY